MRKPAQPQNGRGQNSPNMNNRGAGVPNSNMRQGYGVQRPSQNGRPQNGGAYRQGAPVNQGSQNPYPPVRHVSRKQARKNRIVFGVTVAAIVLLLLSVIIFSARCTFNLASVGDLGETDTSAVTDRIEIPETEPPETEPPLDPNYEYLEKTEADIHTGYQMLINYDNAYVFGDYFNLKTLYSARNGFYKVSNSTDSIDTRALDAFVSMMSAFGEATGHRDVIVTSADRTYEFQEQLYNERVERDGEEIAKLYVALPGHSEHHTGLALDIAIYTDGGEGFTFDDKPEYGEWMRANSYKFGFIERYPASKTEITQTAYENWHYRFVGKPHAYYVWANDLCLEEYIDLLRTHDFKNKLTFTDDEGSSWEIYYVPASGEEITKIPVPKYFEYELSGNNADGFIITVSHNE